MDAQSMISIFSCRLSRQTEFLHVFADGYTQLVTGYTYFESERYNDAGHKLNTAQETFNDSDDLLTVVQERADKIDTEELDTIEQVEQETMQTDLTTMDRLLPVMETLAVGLRQISLGMVDFEQADKDLNEERYLDAESQFNEAVDHFTTAESRFKQQ